MRIYYILSFIIVASTLALISNHAFKGVKRLGITSGEFFHVSHPTNVSHLKGAYYKKVLDIGYLKIIYGKEVPLIISIGSLEFPLVKSPYSISYVSSLILKLLWDKTKNFFYLRFVNIVTFFICSLVLCLLLIKRFDFLSAVVGSMAFQLHIVFISYIYEMNYVILSFLCFYAGLLLQGFLRIFFFILSAHLNTLWMLVFLIVYSVIKFLFCKDIDLFYLKGKSLTNVSVLFALSLILVIIPVLLLFSHPDFTKFYALMNHGNDGVLEKIKAISYLFTFPHVVFLPILFISFILSLIMILREKGNKEERNFDILFLNVSGFFIFALSVLFLLVFVEDKQVVLDLFSRWRKYYSFFTPFTFFAIFNFFSGIPGKLIKSFLFSFILILSIGLGGAEFSRDPRRAFEGQKKEFFVQGGYGVDLSIQRKITEFVMHKIEENKNEQLKIIFISAPLSLGFAFVLSEGKISADYLTCVLFEPNKKFDILVVDLSCKNAEDLIRKLKKIYPWASTSWFPERGERYFFLMTLHGY